MSTLSRLLDRAEQATQAVSRLMGIVAAIAIAGIVTLLTWSSVLRYAVGSPIPVTEELTALLFAALSFLSMPEGFVHDRQIRLGIVWRKLPRPLRNWAMVVGHVFTLVILAWITWWTFLFALFSAELGSRSYESGLLLWPWMMLIPFSLAVLCVAVVVRALVDVSLALKGEAVREEAALAPDGSPSADPEF